MNPSIRPGAVIFTTNHARLAAFYAELVGLTLQQGDDMHAVLSSDTFELVLHALRGAGDSTELTTPREDGYVKLFFPVESLAEAREKAAVLGGRVYPVSKEWEARGFRACDGVDPDGNVIQFREVVS